MQNDEIEKLLADAEASVEQLLAAEIESLKAQDRYFGFMAETFNHRADVLTDLPDARPRYQPMVGVAETLRRRLLVYAGALDRFVKAVRG